MILGNGGTASASPATTSSGTSHLGPRRLTATSAAPSARTTPIRNPQTPVMSLGTDWQGSCVHKMIVAGRAKYSRREATPTLAKANAASRSAPCTLTAILPRSAFLPVGHVQVPEFGIVHHEVDQTTILRTAGAGPAEAAGIAGPQWTARCALHLGFHLGPCYPSALLP